MALDAVTALLADRVRGLLAAKNRQYSDLVGIDPKLLSKWLGGFKKMELADLKQLAEALDSDSNYLIGLGENYRSGGEHDNYAFAAAKMSFGYFIRNLKPTPQQKERCTRVWEDDALLLLEGAPLTANAWLALAAMMDRGAPTIPRIGVANGA